MESQQEVIRRNRCGDGEHTSADTQLPRQCDFLNGRDSTEKIEPKGDYQVVEEVSNIPGGNILVPGRGSERKAEIPRGYAQALHRG